MAQTLEDLGALQGDAPAQPEAPVHVQKLDKYGRAYATGKRKDAVARVWVKPGSGRILVNEKEYTEYFGRPVLQMIIRQPIMLTDRNGQFDVHGDGLRRRPFRPGRRAAPRHLEGAHLLRAGAPAGAEAERLPHPRLARRGAQEIRQAEGPPQLPVLEALDASSACVRRRVAAMAAFFFRLSFSRRGRA